LQKGRKRAQQTLDFIMKDLDRTTDLLRKEKTVTMRLKEDLVALQELEAYESREHFLALEREEKKFQLALHREKEEHQRVLHREKEEHQRALNREKEESLADYRRLRRRLEIEEDLSYMMTSSINAASSLGSNLMKLRSSILEL
jgi:hypothetical protein